MSIYVKNETISEGYRHTYSASGSLTWATGVIDIWSIIGSATKNIRVLKIGMSITETSVAFKEIWLEKRSSANSGGTPTSLTVVPLDSTSPAGTASVVVFTAALSARGGTAGILRATKFLVQNTTPTNSDQTEYIYDFQNRLSNNPVLIGTSESLTLATTSLAFTGGVFNIWVDWTEE